MRVTNSSFYKSVEACMPVFATYILQKTTSLFCISQLGLTLITTNIAIGKEIEDIVILWKKWEHHTNILGLRLKNIVGF